MEKYCREGQAIDENKAHAHYMLDNQDYKYTHSDCGIIMLFTTTMVARRRLGVRLHVNCLSRSRFECERAVRVFQQHRVKKCRELETE